MKNNSFDDRIKGQFSEYRPEVPDHIWENIMAKKEKKRRAGFFFRIYNDRLKFTIIALIVLIVTGLFLNKNIMHHAAKKQLTEYTQAGKTVLKTRTAELKNMEKKSENQKLLINAAPHLEKTGNGFSQQNINPGNSLPTAKNLKSGLENRDENVIQNKTQNVNDKAESAQIKSNSRSARKGNTNIIQVDQRPSADASDGQLETASQINPETRSASGMSKIDAKGKTKRSSEGLLVQIENPETAEELSSFTKSFDEESLQTEHRLNKYRLNLINPFSENPQQFPLSKLNLFALKIPFPSITKRQLSNKRYLEVYGGPDYAFRSLNDNTNPLYLQKRKESTTFSFAFSAGIRYTKFFSKGLSIRTGLNFSQVNEKFKFTDKKVMELMYSRDVAGDTTGSYTASATRYKVTHNKYRTLDIPLLIGYEFGSSKLKANVNFGPVINIYSWQKGDLLDTLSKPVNITTGKSNSVYQFKTNTGIGFLGATSIYFRLTPTFSILAEPYVRYNLSAANKDGLTLKQKYTTTGIRLGLKINF